MSLVFRGENTCMFRLQAGFLILCSPACIFVIILRHGGQVMCLLHRSRIDLLASVRCSLEPYHVLGRAELLPSWRLECACSKSFESVS